MCPILALVKQARIIVENVKDYIKEQCGGGQGGGGKPGKDRGKGRRSAPYWRPTRIMMRSSVLKSLRPIVDL